MSFDTLPDCFKDCLNTAAESVGCTIKDVECVCVKDLAPSDGITFSFCTASACSIDSSVIQEGQQEMLRICAKYKSSSSASGTAKDVKTSSTSNSAVAPKSTGTDATESDSFTSNPTDSPTNIQSSTFASSTKSSPSSASTQTTVSDSKETGGSSGLSAGAGAGIGVGAAIVVILLILGGFLLWRRQKKKNAAKLAASGREGGVPELGGRPKFELDSKGAVPDLRGQNAHQGSLSPIYELPAGVDVVDGASTYGVREMESSSRTTSTPGYSPEGKTLLPHHD